jgi:hypothetical protein
LIACGGCWWFLPWRGRKATERSATVPTATGADGSPYGVRTGYSTASSRKE